MDRGEQEQVERTFERYREDTRKRRAWSASSPGNRAIRTEVAAAALEAVRAAPGPLLDVGCGTGWWLHHLVEQGRAEGLHGVDLQTARVERAARSVPEARLAVADARALPFEDGAYAAVTMLLLLSSLRDRAAMAQAHDEAMRVLAQGGLLVIWDVRFANPRNRATTTPPWRALRHGAVADRTITLLPWLARRLGRLTPRAYPLLARVPALRTHRLLILRKP